MFEQLLSVNVNDHVEKKSGLSYLSWAPAWAEFKKLCPDATYDIKKFNNNLPYVYDEHTGYMVFTSITANGETHEMLLPVMDSSNKAMKAQAYTYDTKYKKGLVVEAATMFDINKTIMRCLVKNMAMFGLGLYIYAGEDLPEGEQPEEQQQPQQGKKKTESDHKKEHDRIMAEIKGKWNTLSAITKTHTDDKERDAALEAWIEKMVSEKSASYTDINATLAKLLKDATDKNKKEQAV